MLIEITFYRSSSYINIDEDTAKLIWRPKVTFFDVLSVEKNDGVGYKHVPEYYFVPNRQIGELQISEQLKMKFPCNFRFEMFPFDKHECNLTYYERQYYSNTLILNSPNQIYHANQKCCSNESSALTLPPKSLNTPIFLSLTFVHTFSVCVR